MKTDDHGRTKTIHGLIRDVAETGILDAFGNGVSIQDRDFRILYQNRKAKDMIGSHIGEFCYRAFEHRDTVCNRCPLERSFQDGKVYTDIRKNPVKKGKLIVEITSSVIRDPHGQVLAGVESVRDITRNMQMEEERNKLICDLAEALTGVKTLRGLLPICYSCKKIRDDKGYWKQVDDYIRENSYADFTHGLCPECVKLNFPQNSKDKV